MPPDTEDIQSNLELAKHFQQLHLHKSPRKPGADAMAKGFREFLLRGNVVDMAVGIVIGAAFGTVVSAFVKDLLTPLIAAIVKKPDFSNIFFSLRGSKFMIGDFANEVISFVLIAAAVYFAVVLPMEKLLTRVRAPASPTTKQCPECMSQIPVAAKRCAFCTTAIAG